MRLPSAIRLLGAAVLAVGLASVPNVAHAHTDLDFTLPTDGASVAEPLSEITIGFTEPVTLVGPGFEVLDPQGNLITPFAVTDDDTVFRLQLDPPIAGGEAAVRYEVRAEDGHVLSGGVRFTIDAAVPTTVPTTTLPATTAPATTATASTTAPITSTAPATTSAPGTVAPSTDGVVDEGAVAATSDTVTAVATDATVAADAEDGGGGTTTMIVIAAVVVALGAAGFLWMRSRSSA